MTKRKMKIANLDEKSIARIRNMEETMDTLIVLHFRPMHALKNLPDPQQPFPRLELPSGILQLQTVLQLDLQNHAKAVRTLHHRKVACKSLHLPDLKHLASEPLKLRHEWLH